MVPDNFHSLGPQLTLVVLLWVTGIFLLLAVGLFLRGSFAGSETCEFFSVVSLVICAGAGTLTALYAIPYNPAYWNLYEVQGKVISVSGNFDSGSGKITTEPVVVLDTVERPVMVKDPRALTLADQDVRLVCTINWNYKAADSYICQIG